MIGKQKPLGKESLKLRGPHPLKKEYKNTLKLSDTQRSVIVGTLLGDGHLEARGFGSRKSHRYYFTQKKDKAEYVKHIYSLFHLWCSKGPAFAKTGKDKNEEITESCYFRTCTHASFDFYAHQFYAEEGTPVKRRKVVPKLLHKWLTPMALAYWFMDDGSRNAYGYLLNTQSFSLKEQEKLADILGRNFHFQVNIHKDRNKYRLYISAQSREAFTNIVKNFILRPPFDQKLHN